MYEFILKYWGIFVSLVLVTGLFAIGLINQDVFAPPPVRPEKIQVGPIKAIANVLSAQSDRLHKIDEKGQVPPDDTRPTALTTLDDITTLCEDMSDTANVMKGDFSRGTGGEHSAAEFSLFEIIPSIQYAAAQATPPDDSKPDPGLANKLASIANVLSTQSEFLDAIKESDASPPPDDTQPVIDELDRIISECSDIIVVGSKVKEVIRDAG